MAADVYARPRTVTSLADCTFYHSMDIPGYGPVEGQWDLRPGIREYCGDVDFAGKRVLEVGTASGFVCFHLEGQGAEVVAYDLSDREAWDLVPFAGTDVAAHQAWRRVEMRKINNGWWLCHRAVRSQAKVVYGSVYEVPAAIGPVDVATYCAILLHLRDPFFALAKGLRLTTETVVVTDMLVDEPEGGEAAGLPHARFVPNHLTGNPADTWWFLSPGLVQRWLGILGFEDTTVSYHTQVGPIAGSQRFFTVVGRRTKVPASGA